MLVILQDFQLSDEDVRFVGPVDQSKTLFKDSPVHCSIIRHK